MNDSRIGWAVGAAFGAVLLAAPAVANIGGDGPPDMLTGAAPAAPAATSQATDLTEGYRAIEAGEYEEATRFFTRIAQAEPTNAEALNQLGYINRRLQNFPQAFAFYNKALELDPQHTGAHHYIGEAYLEVGDLERAEYHLAQLDLICLFGCADYYELEQAVALFKANQTG